MRLVICFFILLLSASSLAERLPKMELGVGVGGQYLGDYRGSSEMQLKAIPIPILIYRGNFLQADRGEVKGRFYTNKRVELNLSAEAALNGGSEDNKKRTGMPELDSAFELGPSVNINLSGNDFSEGLELRLPLRGVYTLSTQKASYIGYAFNPKITWRAPETTNGWKWAVNLGALWASRQYHDYYYSVDESYVTDSRPYYQAESGFSGTYFKTSVKKRRGDFFYGASLRYDNLQGVTFYASPLMETDHYFSISFALGWFFWHSDD